MRNRLFGEATPSRTSQESQLPEYDTETVDLEFDERKFVALKVTCRRCKNWFLVHRSKWRSSSRYESRPCPHCFKVSRIPKRR